MKPFLPAAAVLPAGVRRFVRVLPLLVPALFTSFSFAETWTGTDIGNTGAAGSEWGWPPVPPDFTLTGAGADIQGTADSFRLMHIPVTGDVVAVSKIGFLSSPHAWAKAGVMVRASLDPNSANVAMVLSPSQYCSFQVRTAAGATTDVVLGPRITGPYWVKLTRVGNIFTGSISPDGTTWTLVGSREVVLPAPVYAGFAVCSHVVGTTMSADFDFADVNGTAVAPLAPSNVTATNVGPHSADITWTDNSNNEDGFRIYVEREVRHGEPPHLAGTVAPNVTSFTLTGLASESYYWVYVRAFRNGTEVSAPTLSLATPQDPTEPPETPYLWSVQPSGPNAIDVSWQETGGMDSSYETGFELERATDGATFTRIVTLPANTLGYHDTGLTVGTTYSYRVRAVKETLYSGWSRIGSARAMGALTAPTGLTIDSASATLLRLTWTDNSADETRFELERSTAGGPFQLFQSLATNTTTYTDTTVVANTTYSYRVRAANTAVSDYSNTATATAVDTPPDPAEWSGIDIGSPALAGSDSGVPPSFTMEAAGADIQGTSDSFRFMTKTVNGDTTLIARVASLTNTHSWAKAGAMIRASLAPNSAYAAIFVSPAQTCSFQWRYAGGSETYAPLGPWVTPPYWVKLTRVGFVFTGYVSPDGVTWTQVGTRSIPMAAQLHAGFAVTSHNESARTTAVFDHAEATDSSPPPPPPSWIQQTWGGATGSFTPASGADAVASITATSGDIYGASDSGVFVYQTATGPMTLVIRVNSLTNSHAWAKAGLMIRASLEPNAANAFVALTPGTGAVFQSRSALGGAQTTTVGHNWSPRPGALLKLVRDGGIISAFFSTNNGAAWSSLGSVTDDLPETIYLGYAASSHNPSVATTATFAQPE